MSIRMINLNKLLRICGSSPAATTSALREDLRAERDNLLGLKAGGGHFQHPWWKAAKDHAVGFSDLPSETEKLIEVSDRRKRLYPIYTKSFLDWIDHFRRSTNYEFGCLPEHVHAHYVVPDLDLTVKVDNVLALKIGFDRRHIVYPYFAEVPSLTTPWARIGLWLMSGALSEYASAELELLDVFRGRGFSGASLFPRGDEETVFHSRFRELLSEWLELRKQYDLPTR
jgi:hypothetical protein